MRSRRLGRLTIAASLGQAAWATRRQWQALPPERRSRLQALLRQSAGGPRTSLKPTARNFAASSANSTSAKCYATARSAPAAVGDAGEAAGHAGQRAI